MSCTVDRSGLVRCGYKDIELLDAMVRHRISFILLSLFRIVRHLTKQLRFLAFAGYSSPWWHRYYWNWKLLRRKSIASIKLESTAVRTGVVPVGFEV